jgi:hypothetical protein
VKCRGPTLSTPCTRTWLPVTDLASGRFTYVAPPPKLALQSNTSQILKVVEVEKTDDIRRPYIKQLLTKNLKFPLPHRVSKKNGGKIFASHRPSTFF